MDPDIIKWLIALAAAFFIGLSKTGIPGVGILAVALLAHVYGGWTAVGLMLPMLVFGDCFGAFWYREHVRWDKILKLYPWVVVGVALGGMALWLIGGRASHKDVLAMIIGFMLLGMLVLYLLQGWIGDHLSSESKVNTAGIGAGTGFVTTISNSAGPLMQIYLTAHKLPKNEFVGTLAWYFFIINVSKLPVYYAMNFINPAKPMITGETLLIGLKLVPGILAGVYFGKWLLPRIPQKAFNYAVLFLAGMAALKLILG